MTTCLAWCWKLVSTLYLCLVYPVGACLVYGGLGCGERDCYLSVCSLAPCFYWLVLCGNWGALFLVSFYAVGGSCLVAGLSSFCSLLTAFF